MKFTWDSTFVDAYGPRDAIEIKPISNTANLFLNLSVCTGLSDPLLRTQTIFLRLKLCLKS